LLKCIPDVTSASDFLKPVRQKERLLASKLTKLRMRRSKIGLLKINSTRTIIDRLEIYDHIINSKIHVWEI
jgi:hypothetical protein